MAVMVLFFNFHGQGMSGILPYYRNFKEIILSGFDPAAVAGAVPTFPMWGYGWVFLLTENKLAILVFQNVLSIFSIWFCLRLADENTYLPSGVITLAKILVVVAVPWYAFHSLLWPYSTSNSLIILALFLFVKAISSKYKTPYPLLISGLLFGLALNFRSDYYLFPMGLILIIGLTTEFSKQFLQKSALWLALIYLTLIPWGLYTKSATGHFLITSTNAGATLFIGLGNLPGNKWGITPTDSDPRMHRDIQSHFGEKTSFVSYKADQFLKTAVLEKIMEDPAHFGKKVLYNLKKTLLGGIYPGEFYESADCYPQCNNNYRENIGALRSNPSHYFKLDMSTQAIIPMNLYSELFSKAIVLLSYLLLPLTIIYSMKNQNLLSITFLCAIAWQTALNMVGFYLSTYTGNIFIFLLINLCLGIYLLTR
ncbi:MAG: hypothetical protein ACE5GL_07920, partial [Calditrichia bacterium]